MRGIDAAGVEWTHHYLPSIYYYHSLTANSLKTDVDVESFIAYRFIYFMLLMKLSLTAVAPSLYIIYK